MEQTKTGQAPELEELIPPKDIGKYGAPERTQRVVQIARGEFPAPVRLSERRVAWIKRELIEWQRAKIAARDGKK